MFRVERYETWIIGSCFGWASALENSRLLPRGKASAWVRSRLHVKILIRWPKVPGIPTNEAWIQGSLSNGQLRTRLRILGKAAWGWNLNQQHKMRELELSGSHVFTIKTNSQVCQTVPPSLQLVWFFRRSTEILKDFPWIFEACYCVYSCQWTLHTGPPSNLLKKKWWY